MPPGRSESTTCPPSEPYSKHLPNVRGVNGHSGPAPLGGASLAEECARKRELAWNDKD
jgi:hypothetical protein